MDANEVTKVAESTGEELSPEQAEARATKINHIMVDVAALPITGKAVLVGVLIDAIEWQDNLLDLAFAQMSAETVDKIATWISGRN